MTGLDVVVISIVTFRLAWLFTREDFPPVKWFRDWMLVRFPSADAFYTYDHIDRELVDGEYVMRGKPMLRLDDGQFVLADEDDEHAFGTLVTCPWCISFWLGLAVAGVWFEWGDNLYVAVVYVALMGSAAAGVVAGWLESE